MTREQWQIDQGKACPCGGSDDYCPCQNVEKAAAEVRTKQHGGTRIELVTMIVAGMCHKITPEYVKDLAEGVAAGLPMVKAANQLIDTILQVEGE